MRNIVVGDIMTRNFVSINPTDSLYVCSKLMAKNRVNSVLVTDKKRLLGIITARDVLWAITKKPGIDLKKVRCFTIATKKIAVIKPSADINQIMRKMRELNFRRIPVISKGNLIGVVTLKDILAIDPSLYREARPIMDEIREEEIKLERIGQGGIIEGICDNCGALSELLKINGTALCADCRDEIY